MVMLACLHNWAYFLPVKVLASNPSQFLELTNDTLYSRLREMKDAARMEYFHSVIVLGLALGRKGAGAGS